MITQLEFTFGVLRYNRHDVFSIKKSHLRNVCGFAKLRVHELLVMDFIPTDLTVRCKNRIAQILLKGASMIQPFLSAVENSLCTHLHHIVGHL